jgi:hypothetical protein
MRYLVAFLIFIVGLATSKSSTVLAQSLSAVSFLNGVSANPVDDQAQRDLSRQVYRALNGESRSELERELPTILLYTTSSNEVHARLYAVLFLTSIAMRPDGADLLSINSEEISSLIVDANPTVQREALAVMDYVLAKAVTNKRPYLRALEAAIQSVQTPQSAGGEIIVPLLIYNHDDLAVVGFVLAFMRRGDLTVSTRLDLLHHLSDVPNLPREVNQALAGELDDPDPRVRAAAVVAFAESTTEFHALALDRVARIAKDPQENAQVREKAMQALAGKRDLDPNIDLPSKNKKNH